LLLSVNTIILFTALCSPHFHFTSALFSVSPPAATKGSQWKEKVPVGP